MKSELVIKACTICLFGIYAYACCNLISSSPIFLLTLTSQFLWRSQTSRCLTNELSIYFIFCPPEVALTAVGIFCHLWPLSIVFQADMKDLVSQLATRL